MRELGLDDTYGAYLAIIPGVMLATVNLASYFGLHRRLRGALVGHLAVFEMTSVEPMGRYSTALRRHGFWSWARCSTTPMSLPTLITRPSLPRPGRQTGA
jgi:heme oxygenase-like protein